MLKRFWFEFEKLSKPTALNLGCGITAYDYDDAIYILQTKVFAESNPPKVNRVVENVDVSLLDPKHVLPNIGNVACRGVWFPLGFEATTEIPRAK